MSGKIVNHKLKAKIFSSSLSLERINWSFICFTCVYSLQKLSNWDHYFWLAVARFTQTSPCLELLWCLRLVWWYGLVKNVHTSQRVFICSPSQTIPCSLTPNLKKNCCLPNQSQYSATSRLFGHAIFVMSVFG